MTLVSPLSDGYGKPSEVSRDGSRFIVEMARLLFTHQTDRALCRGEDSRTRVSDRNAEC